MSEEPSVANKEEAEKCFEIAKVALHKGDYPKAVKFFDKSLRLYPITGAQKLKEKAEHLAAGGSESHSTGHAHGHGHGHGHGHNGSSSSSNGGAASAAASSTRSSSSGNIRDHTPEQETGAKKILALAKKSHYDVLAIHRDADDDKIKKAYRKLALKFHPDKNSAPSSEAAFKAISTAFDTLSDPIKRETYDQVGHEASVNGGGGGMNGFHGGFPASAFAQAFGGGGRGGVQMHEINPEDLFNMFFHGQGVQGFRGGRGGGFRDQQRQDRDEHERQQRRQHQQQTPREPPSLFMQLLQFLPIILLFLMSMSTFGGNSSQPLFTFVPQGQYRDLRRTSSQGVIQGVPYYVQSNFLKNYKPGTIPFSKLENGIVIEYRDALAADCAREKQRRNTMMARVWTQKEREKLMNTIPTPSCDTYTAVFVDKNRNYLSQQQQQHERQQQHGSDQHSEF